MLQMIVFNISMHPKSACLLDNQILINNRTYPRVFKMLVGGSDSRFEDWNDIKFVLSSFHYCIPSRRVHPFQRVSCLVKAGTVHLLFGKPSFSWCYRLLQNFNEIICHLSHGQVSQHVVSADSSYVQHHSFYCWYICFPWCNVGRAEEQKNFTMTKLLTTWRFCHNSS